VNNYSRRQPKIPAPQPGPVASVRGTDRPVTAYGGSPLLRQWLQALRLPQRLAQLDLPWAGRAFSGAEYVWAMLCGLLLGRDRQSSLAALGADLGALLGLGLEGVPSQPSLSRFLARGTTGASRQILQISRELGQRMRQKQRTGILDLDGSVIATRGHPEGADYGYNPKRRGKTYFACLSFCGHTREILDAVLRSGHEATVSASCALQMYRQGRRALGGGLKRVLLRADAAFARFEFLRQLQRENVTYFIAWPVHGALRAQLPGLDYQALDERWAVAQLPHQVPGGREQRLVVIREKLEPDERHQPQLTLLEAPGYAFQVIATNAADGWSGAAVWRFYNHRSCLENIIKESKEDFGGDHILSHCWEGNRFWLALSVLAYNLWNWFREKILDQRAHRHQAQWLRRRLIELPAYVTRGGRRWYLNIWRGSPGWELYQRAQARLQVFRL
jgi:hypothetical protein